MPSSSDDELKAIQEELKWISIEESQSFRQKVNSKGIFNILVPAGCIATVGVLGAGLYQFYRNDSKKQQILMRYRVLTQGLTLGLAVIGILSMNFK